MRTATLNSKNGQIGQHGRLQRVIHTFSDVRQLREELIELLLTLVELTPAHEVDTKQGHDAVDNQETVFVTDEEFSNLVEKLHLMLRVDGTSICNILLS